MSSNVSTEKRTIVDKEQKYTLTKPEIIITDENSVVRNELSFNEPGDKLLQETEKAKQNSNEESLTDVYARRWIILLIFSGITLLSAFNWIEYNIIQDVTIAFYNRSLPEGFKK